MQLLIVHRDPELGGQLVQMVKDYTRHDCDLVTNETAAIQRARDHSRCASLITQLDSAIALSRIRLRLQICPPMETISGSWDCMLTEAVAKSKEQSAPKGAAQAVWAKLRSQVS
jgi:hypothetical protein